MIDSATVRMSGEPVARIGGAAASEKAGGAEPKLFQQQEGGVLREYKYMFVCRRSRDGNGRTYHVDEKLECDGLVIYVM